MHRGLLTAAPDRRCRVAGLWLLASLLTSVGCQTDPSGPPRAVVKTIELSGPDSVEVGQRGTLALTLRDSLGAAIVAAPDATWSLSDTTVARLLGVPGAAGTLEARATGTVVATVRAYGLTTTRPVRVVPPSARVAEVTLRVNCKAFALDTLEVGDLACVSVDARDSVGRRLYPGIDNPGRVTVIWTFSDSAALEKPRFGLEGAIAELTGRAPGVVTIAARVNSVLATTTLRVITPPSAPPAPVAGALTWSAVGAGVTHSCGLTTGGAVYCWGGNANGQLGPPAGTPPFAAEPRPVSLPTRAVQLSVGPEHNCAVGVDGVAYCWGEGRFGRLGRQPAGSLAVASDVPFAAVFAGGTHTCALTADGEAYCWGLDEHGQLGAPASAETCSGGDPFYCRTLPAPVRTGQRFTQLALGTYHSCGLTAAGAVYCWGATDLGRGVPGDEICRFFPRTGGGPISPRSTACSRTPQPVAGGARFTALSPRSAAFASSGATCGVREDGAVLCWEGQRLPAAVPEVTGAREVSVLSSQQPIGAPFRSRFGCVVTQADAVLCWGSNRHGQLGVAGVDSSATPVASAPPASPAASVSTGGTHACSLTRAGQIVCWGNPRSGRLGRGP